ncbi:phospholipase D-like domain-containing protein [Anabaena cylindrica UHCC 0172]|uniref:phospholipase D-like domain-containing protein n=1 Tax=Anabaena cylindrica TaxID=1165 RepID=UPI002B206FD4|nr:phospholipase D-like domain-containing protein [Anabaena cylindrica]MEA5552824.1 phospholipase D-like domain-containing protein [Anabaena cylindrica UHCC 0172]
MNQQSQWLFESAPLLEIPHRTYSSPDQNYDNNPELMEWETQAGILQSAQFRGDQRLQAAANNNPPLKKGQRGSAVRKLQQVLIDLGYPMAITTKQRTQPADGIYGNETVAIVRKFQQRYGLQPDGIAGRQTLTTLDRLLIKTPSRIPPRVPPHVPPQIPDQWKTAMGGTKVRSGNQTEFLIDGRRTFEAMVKAIRTATNQNHYIYLLGWWLTDNFLLIPGFNPRDPNSPPLTPGDPSFLPRDPNSAIAKLFADAASRGVQIRVMLWDQFGTQNTAEVKRINKLRTGGAILDNETLNYGSHHQKVLIIKGSEGLISFCGGVDINPDRLHITPSSGSSSPSSGGQGAPLHDVHCQIIGPAAHDLLATFIQRWMAHPEHKDIDKNKGGLLGLREPVPSAKGTHFVRIARTFNQIGSRKCQKARSIRTVMTGLIRAARKFIYIEDQYLVSMKAAAELRNALPRIQHLTIVIPHSSISDLPQVWARRKAFIDLLKSSPHGHKVRVFYLVNPASGTFAAFTYVHAKTWIFDDEVAVIGSANCNRRGWSYDSEVIAAIYDGSPAANGHIPFAQKLRMALWSRHLNVSSSKVQDGLVSAALWLRPVVGSWIRPYNENAGTDPGWHKRLSWDSKIDPSADSLPSCTGGVETEVAIPYAMVSEFHPYQLEKTPILR